MSDLGLIIGGSVISFMAGVIITSISGLLWGILVGCTIFMAVIGPYFLVKSLNKKQTRGNKK